MQVIRSAQRFTSRSEGIVTRHAFSYGVHYDPDNVAFGALRAINDELLAPGAGYPAHRHADVEIVTWVVAGTLRHIDTTGDGGVISPGLCQRLSAGAGAEHTEVNASDTHDLRFVQMMLTSRHASEPAYAAIEVPPGPGLHVGVEVAADARLLLARPGGADLDLPGSPRVLVYVVLGSALATVAGKRIELDAGDQLRITGGDSIRLSGEAEAIVWLLD